MNLKLLENDFKKNPWSNLILFLFMSFSAAIAVAVTLMLTQLFTSISTMYEIAKPPHFLQMHKGELVQEDIDRFNSRYDGIEYWQTVSMIDIYGDELSAVPGPDHASGKQFSLSDCRLDISLVRQNERYDVLLDENRNRVEIGPDEIGVPVILLEQYDISVGDQIILNSGDVKKTFQVAAFVYDGQMNSTLCSSTRFLISDSNFEELYGNVGEIEYLIEAWFEDSSQAAGYQTAYEQSDADLPKNGQAVTYTMIFLLSAMTDLMMALVFVSILTGHMNRTFGEQRMSIGSCGMAVIICAAVYGVILVFSRKVVGRLLKASVTDLLVTEKGFGKKAEAKDGLRRAKRLPVNLRIGLKEAGRGYGIVFGLLLIVSILMVVPGRTAQTMEDEEFITYMGSPVCDLLLEVEQGEDLEIRKSAADNLLEKERNQGRIEKTDMLRRVRLQAIGAETEIALSCLMAEELEKEEADTVILVSGGKQSSFTVCGIYQDVTSGGRTSRTVCQFPEEPAEKYTYQINLSQARDSGMLSENWREQLGNGYAYRCTEFIGYNGGNGHSGADQSKWNNNTSGNA